MPMEEQTRSAKTIKIASSLVFARVIGLSTLHHSYGRDFTLDKTQRDLFFSSANKARSLLKSHPSNPILNEEGIKKECHKIDGEYFITPIALTLLLANDIKKYRARNEADHYNTEHIFVINNDEKKLSLLLSNLNLKPEGDAKIVYVDGVHAVAFYLRNCSGKIKCYIADSQGLTHAARYIARAVQLNIGSLDIVIGPELQKDYYSCFTFAKKAVGYFIKHGKEVFEHINQVNTITYENHEILSLKDLMPNLLKFCQYNYSSLPTAVLDAVVSIKAKITLREYLSENKQVCSEKKFNSAALKAKYRYFHQLNQIVTPVKMDKELLEIAMSIYSNPSMLQKELLALNSSDEPNLISKSL